MAGPLALSTTKMSPMHIKNPYFGMTKKAMAEENKHLLKVTESLLGKGLSPAFSRTVLLLLTYALYSQDKNPWG